MATRRDRPPVPARARHTYHGFDDGELIALAPERGSANPLATIVHDQLRAMLLSQTYTCLGAAAAMRRRLYRLGVYPPLSSPEAVEAHATDLLRFTREYPQPNNPVAVFISVFDGPVRTTDAEFEADMWRHLAALDVDNPSGDDEHPSPDTVSDPGFIYSGRNFFVVGLHPGASRWARRFAWPTLVFNALSHGEPLRESGKYDRMTQRIRERDRRLQGTVNPSLERPRVAQFSGRAVPTDWTCPMWNSSDEKR